MRVCAIANCGVTHRARGYCKRHYEQLRVFGEVQEYNKNDHRPAIVDGDMDAWFDDITLTPTRSN